MKDLAGKIAVVTGGGAGIGRELTLQLAAAGASVAICDVSQAAMAETKALCEARGLAPGARITVHLVDVSDVEQVLRFRDEVVRDMQTDHVHLLFNNAGIGGGSSMFTDSPANWERTFNVCWGGVYNMTRSFLPMVVKAEAGHISNTSSLSGIWASLGPTAPHTAYSAAKFAVKGFTEALITDLKVNAPHVTCSVVMPGRIGTNIIENTRMVMQRRDSPEMTDQEVQRKRARLEADGVDVEALSDADIRAMVAQSAADRRGRAPMGPAEAATIILDAIRAGRWRILVGEDAIGVDQRVRAHPEQAYDDDFEGPFGKPAPVSE